MAEEQSTPATETVPGTNPKDLSQVVQGTAENLLNKLEENLGEQKGELPKYIKSRKSVSCSTYFLNCLIDK